MRLRWSRRTVWIDAICINQDDVNERGHQVHLMPQIYSRARRVLIYTGEALPEDGQLLELLATGVLDQASRVDWEEMRKALWKFFSRRYFSRVWILQEVALARQAILLCGSHSILWSSFQAPQLVAKGFLLPAKMKDLPSVVHFQARQYRDSADLLQLLDRARPSHATDPRDKVFAVFGLLSGAESDGFRADYTLTAKDVFLRIAEWIVQRFGIVALLIRCMNQDGTNDEALSPALQVRDTITNADLEEARRFLRFANEANLRGEELKKRFDDVLQCEADADGLEFMMGLANEGNLDVEDLRPLLFPRAYETLSRKLPSWVPDWRFKQTSGILDELSGEDFSLRKVRLPVKVLVDDEILRVPVLRVGRFINELANSSRSRPWPYWTLGEKRFDLSPDFEAWRFPRSENDYIYLVPRPDEYKSFSFEEPGRVLVYANASSFRWIHKSPEGQITATGYFSQWVICGFDTAVNLVCLRGLMQMRVADVSPSQIWRIGHFEHIEIDGDFWI